MADKKSRADYYAKRRKAKNLAQFNVTVDKDKLSALSAKLDSTGETKKAWLDRKIDEELKE